MAEPKQLEGWPASVTLRDLATDLEYWKSQFELHDPDISAVAIGGLESLIEVIRGYSEAGFYIRS